MSKRGQRNAGSSRDADAEELEALTEAEIASMERVDLRASPALIEQVRRRHRLRLLSFRVGEEQIAVAREIAAKTGEPYQAVLRRWLAEGAEREFRTPPRRARRLARRPLPPSRKRLGNKT